MSLRRPATPIANARAAETLPMPGRIAAIINPIAAHSDEAAAELLRQTSAAGIEVIEKLTTRKNPGERQAAQALAEEVDLVVAIGGDGTVRRVAGAMAGSATPLAVVPAGSGNVLARNLGLRPTALDQAVGQALSAATLDVDLGWAKMISADQVELADEPFLVMAGIGRDAEAVQSTRAFLKRRWGWGAYAESGVRHALAGPISMQVSYDEQEPREITTWTLLAGNLPYVPAGIQVFPQARIDDGKLQALEVPIENPLQWAPIVLRGLGGAAPKAKLNYVNAKRITVEPAEPQPVQLDGDIFKGVTRLELSVQANALRLRVPAKSLQ